MPERFKDFDTFFAEMNRAPIRLRLFGEEHDLPPSIPAAMVLLYRRLNHRNATEEVEDGEVLDLFTSLFGQERTDKWFAKGLDVEQMVHLLSWAMEQYGVSGNKASDPNSKRPEKVQRGKARA